MNAPAAAPSPPPRKKSLSTAMVTVSVVAALAPLLVFGAWTVHVCVDVLTRRVGEDVSKDAQRCAADIERTLYEKQRVLVGLAHSDLLRRSAPDDADGIFAHLAADACRDDAQVASLDCVGPDGVIRASSAPERRGRLVLGAWLPQAMARPRGMVVVAEPREHADVALVLATPVFAHDDDRVPSAVLALELLRSVASISLVSQSEETEERAVFVRAADGTILFDSRPDDKEAALAVLEVTRALVGPSAHGGRYALVGGWVGSVALAGGTAESPWQVITLERSAVAFAPVYGLLRTALVVGIASALAATLVASALGRRIVLPLRELTRVVSRIADEGDLSKKIKVGSSDEVGRLASAFGLMVERLQKKQAELLVTIDELGARRAEAAQLARVAQEERAKLESTLIELREAQATIVRSERLAAIGELAGGLAHDLRNPLGTIRNAWYYLSRKLAQSDVALDRRVAPLCKLIDVELERCAKSIRDLLDYARERPLSKVPTLMAVLVREALAVVAKPAPTIDVKTEIGPELVAHLDPDLFHTAVVNLVQNAVEVVDPLKGLVSVRARLDGEQVALEVEDDGPGIAAEARSHLFEPLFTTKRKGTGLGLAIVDRVVKAHGGVVHARPASGGRGTTFEVRIPVGTASPGPKPIAGGAADAR